MSFWANSHLNARAHWRGVFPKWILKWRSNCRKDTEHNDAIAAGWNLASRAVSSQDPMFRSFEAGLPRLGSSFNPKKPGLRPNPPSFRRMAGWPSAKMDVAPLKVPNEVAD